MALGEINFGKDTFTTVGPGVPRMYPCCTGFLEPPHGCTACHLPYSPYYSLFQGKERHGYVVGQPGTEKELDLNLEKNNNIVFSENKSLGGLRCVTDRSVSNVERP